MFTLFNALTHRLAPRTLVRGASSLHALRGHYARLFAFQPRAFFHIVRDNKQAKVLKLELTLPHLSYQEFIKLNDEARDKHVNALKEIYLAYRECAKAVFSAYRENSFLPSSSFFKHLETDIDWIAKKGGPFFNFYAFEGVSSVFFEQKMQERKLKNEIHQTLIERCPTESLLQFLLQAKHDAAQASMRTGGIKTQEELDRLDAQLSIYPHHISLEDEHRAGIIDALKKLGIDLALPNEHEMCDGLSKRQMFF